MASSVFCLLACNSSLATPVSPSPTVLSLPAPVSRHIAHSGQDSEGMPFKSTDRRGGKEGASAEPACPLLLFLPSGNSWACLQMRVQCHPAKDAALHPLAAPQPSPPHKLRGLGGAGFQSADAASTLSMLPSPTLPALRPNQPAAAGLPSGGGAGSGRAAGIPASEPLLLLLRLAGLCHACSLLRLALALQLGMLSLMERGVRKAPAREEEGGGYCLRLPSLLHVLCYRAQCHACAVPCWSVCVELTISPLTLQPHSNHLTCLTRHDPPLCSAAPVRQWSPWSRGMVVSSSSPPSQSFPSPSAGTPRHASDIGSDIQVSGAV